MFRDVRTSTSGRVTQPRRRCIFCGQVRQMSLEHVIPRWVVPIVDKARDSIPAVRSFAKFRRGEFQREVSGRYPALVTRRVCKACNEGWLENDIEAPAREVATSLILGDRRVLRVDHQERLAAWAAKIAILGRYAHEPPEPVPDAWIQDLYLTHAAPPTWITLVGRYSEGATIAYSNHNMSSRPPKADGSHATDGIFLTLVVGHLAIKVLGFANPTTINYPADLVLPIWPDPDGDRDWPPASQVTPESFGAFDWMYIGWVDFGPESPFSGRPPHDAI